MNTNIELLESQIRQIFASVVWTHKIQEKQADIYRDRYNKLETAKILVSSITSAGIISIIFVDGLWLKIATAIISMITIAINTYYKNFDLISMANEHKHSALQLLRLREKLICLLCGIKMQKLNEDEIIKERDEILEELMNAYDNARDATSGAVNKASQHLKERGDLTYSDEDIDSFLPIYLKKGGN
jgi:hypothetical protein